MIEAALALAAEPAEIWEPPLDVLADNTGDLIQLPPLRSLSEFTERPPATEFAVEKIAPIGSVSMITGAPNVGKTLLGSDLAISVASGTDFLGLACQQGDALFVNTEMPEGEMVRRLQDQCDPRGLLRNIPVHIITTTGTFADLDQTHDHIIAECEARGIKPKLVFVDSFYLAHSGGDENLAGDTIPRMLVMQSIASTLNAAVVFVHHHSKGPQSGKDALDRASGSGVLGRFVAAHGCLSKLDGPTRIDDRGGVYTPYRLEWGKARYTAIPEPIDLWFDYPSFTVDVEGILAGCTLLESGAGSRKQQRTAERKKEQLVTAINKHVEEQGEKPTREDLMESLGLSMGTLRDRIKVAIADGLIVEDRSSQPYRYEVAGDE